MPDSQLSDMVILAAIDRSVEIFIANSVYIRTIPIISKGNFYHRDTENTERKG